MTSAETTINKFVKQFPPGSTTGYLYWPLPNHLDDELTRIIKSFVDSPHATQDMIGARFRGEYSGMLQSFAERMSILGVRESSPERLFDGLVALVIEDFSADYRETMPIVSLLYNSALRIAADPQDLFEQAAAIASPESAQILREFTQSPQSIEAMGYKEVTDDGGFWYQRTW